MSQNSVRGDPRASHRRRLGVFLSVGAVLGMVSFAAGGIYERSGRPDYLGRAREGVGAKARGVSTYVDSLGARSEEVEILLRPETPAGVVPLQLGRDRTELAGRARRLSTSDGRITAVIELPGPESLFGMNAFELEHPVSSAWMRMWLLTRMLEREGLPRPQQRLARLTLDGERVGPAAFSEAVDAPGGLAERLGAEWARSLDAVLGEPDQGHLTGAVRADVATIFALGDLLGAHDVVGFENIFLLGSSSGRPIVVMRPGSCTQCKSGSLGASYLERAALGELGEAGRVLFEDRDFLSDYLRTLEVVTAPSYLEDAVESFSDDLEAVRRQVHGSVPGYSFDLDEHFAKRDLIYERLHPLLRLKAFHRPVEAGDQRIEASVANSHFLPVEIVGVRCSQNGVVYRTLDDPVLARRPFSSPLRYTRLAFGVEEAGGCGEGIERIGRRMFIDGLVLNYRILGTREELSVPVEAYPLVASDVDDGAGRSRASVTEGLSELEWLEVDPESRRFEISPGVWSLSQDLIVPAGYTLIAGPGTTLQLLDRAAIISYSPVRLVGEADRPIRIGSPDGTGRGLLVLGTTARSVLKNVSFEGLSTTRRGAIELTGSVTFYEADVDIEQCSFSDNLSEDALNIIRSDFTIRGSRFQRTYSDAFDSDFSTGTLEESVFADTANDAVDVSGSKVVLRSLEMSRIGDKGISAGEGSQVRAEDIHIEEANIALASKDLSELSVDGVRLVSSEIGVAAYQKKPHFGPGQVLATDLSEEDSVTSHLIEEGSTYVLEDRAVPANAEELAALLYTDESP